MNSMISCSRVLAVMLGAAALAGCNAVEDVPDEPATARPAETAVLGGTVTNLGTRRPLVLQYNGADSCLVPVSTSNPSGPKVVSECQFYGILDQEASVFSFGSVPVGGPYNITVKRQPFGKICTVQNPTGTVQTGGAGVSVTCVDDPAVPHYTVTVNIAPEAASKPGLQVILTTENGTCPVDVNGRSVVTFSPSECPDVAGGYHRNGTYLFNNQSSLPVFPWRVTATVPGATAIAARTNCYVTNTSSPPLVVNTGGNTNDSGVATDAPTGNIVAGTINVESCGFPVRVQADYSRSPTESADPVIAGGDGITVSLRSQPYGVDVAAAKITSFAATYTQFMVPDANGDPTTTPYEAQAEPNAFYEVVVKKSPAGMACMPGSSVSANSLRAAANRVGSLADGGAVLLRRPSSAAVPYVWLIDRVIRCRLVATTPAAQLRGMHWQYTVTTTTRIVSGVPSVTVATTQNRNLLTFFEDGQYIFGNHSGSQTTSEGLEQGFYAYNPGASTIGTLAAKSIQFVAMTDTTGGSGLNNSGAARTLTNVVTSAGHPKLITARFSSTGPSAGFPLVTGGLTVALGTGSTVNVAAATYTTVGGLVNGINTAAGTTVIAAASGNEIVITGPPGGVTFGGSAVAVLGLPTTVAAGATATSNNVANNLTGTNTTVVDWNLLEIGPDTRVTTTNALDGGWVTWDWQRLPAPVEDRRRVFAYQHGVYNLLHFGVNGIPNMQATCAVGNFGLSGTWTRQGSGQGCVMTVPTDTVTNGSAPVRTLAPASGSFASGDIPSPVTSASAVRDIPGRWPQSQNPSYTDGRPYSLVEYEIRLAGTVPGDPVCPDLDKLTVWDTINGIRKDTLDPPVPRLVLCRIVAN